MDLPNIESGFYLAVKEGWGIRLLSKRFGTKRSAEEYLQWMREASHYKGDAAVVQIGRAFPLMEGKG